MAGNAAAIMTASRAEIKAVRFNVAKAAQKRPDFPAQMFLRCLVASSCFSPVSEDKEALAGVSMEDMMIFSIVKVKPIEDFIKVL